MIKIFALVRFQALLLSQGITEDTFCTQYFHILHNTFKSYTLLLSNLTQYYFPILHNTTFKSYTILLSNLTRFCFQIWQKTTFKSYTILLSNLTQYTTFQSYTILLSNLAIYYFQILHNTTFKSYAILLSNLTQYFFQILQSTSFKISFKSSTIYFQKLTQNCLQNLTQ